MRALPASGRLLPTTVDDPAVALDQAIAEDRFDDATAIVATLSPDDPRAPGCALAVRRLGGHVVETLTATDVTDRRGRRAQAAARRDRTELAHPLPVTGPRPRSTGDVPPGAGRILHVVTNSLPQVQAGSTIRTHRVASAQQAAGWSVAVATRPGFPVLTGGLSAAAVDTVDGVEYHRLLPRIAPSRMRIPAVYREGLITLARAVRADVLHGASDHVNACAALEAGRALGLPVAYEARGFPEDTWLSRHGGDAAVDTDTYRWLSARHTEVLRAADVVTTLGRAMREAIIERGVDPDRVIVTPNGVLPEYLQPRGERDDVRSRLGLDGGELLVGSITTVYPHEGLVTLVEAVAVARERGLDVRALVVGDGPDLNRVRARADHLGVPLATPGRIPVARVREYFDALDVFALPRSDDRLTRIVTALKPLEAQARGVPVVGSDLPAVAEVLAPGSPLVPAGDAERLAGSLLDLAEPSRRARMGESAREWIAAHRTWPTVMDSYRSAYHSVGVPVPGPSGADPG